MKIKSLIYGSVIGDCLGVPVEFEPRHALRRDPVVDMRGFGSHHVPAGTWSDDTSMTYALAESILEGYDPLKLGMKFVDWLTTANYTATGKVFDVGMTSHTAIKNFSKTKSIKSGCGKDSDNGNGSLMRIAPLVIILKDIKDINKRYELVKEVSSLTHSHIRSILACMYFCELLIEIYNGVDRFEAYDNVSARFSQFLKDKNINSNEQMRFERIIDDYIWEYPEMEIFSSGYVIHTLEASLWSFYNNDNFMDAVLTAVNLGDDTDTTGAITGSLAGLFFGFNTFPKDCINKVLKGNEIIDLCDKLQTKFK